MNAYPHLDTTTRNVPIELWTAGDAPTGRRIPTAPMSTCAACGASFYADNVWGQATVPIVPPAPPPPEQWDC